MHHKWGHGSATGVTFENVDIERTDSNDNIRAWAVFHVVDGSQGGAGPVSSVTVRNIRVRDAGKTPALIKGASATAGFDGVTFDSITMPGRAGFATSLADLGVTGPLFAANVTVLPAAPAPSASPSAPASLIHARLPVHAGRHEGAGLRRCQPAGLRASA